MLKQPLPPAQLSPSIDAAPTAGRGSCIHHWLLSEPTGGQVPGRCKRCGEFRSFPASPEGGDRFDDYRELTESSSFYPGERASG